MVQQSKFNVGDLVMFANRTQNCMCGMRVQQIDANMFDVRIQVDYKWWTEGSLISFEEWKKIAKI